ncbi:MAG: hypothetical protein D6780_07420, partial [Candidatus Dadabacteria bacterium]
EFRAAMAKWRGLNRYATQMGSSSNVFGVFVGALNPGDKPTDMMGMAMSGRLNSKGFTLDKDGNKKFFEDKNSAKANFYDPNSNKAGSYNKMLTNSLGRVKQYNGKRVRDAYRNTRVGPAAALGRAVSTVAQNGITTQGTQDATNNRINELQNKYGPGSSKK